MSLPEVEPRPRPPALRLTPELVALAARKVDDAGPAPGAIVHSDDDYEASLQALLKAGAWQGQDLWVFAYGSLLWNPAFESVEQLPAVLNGWHRAFCIRLTRFRGTLEQPGLMMSLVPGGCCRGVLYRIAGDRVLDSLRKLWRREMTVRPPTSPPRWVNANAGQRPVQAITFAANRNGPNYVGGVTPEQIADVLSKAVGHWGSGAEYLMQTVDHLDRFGIRDTNLWRLQQLVAQRLLGRQAGCYSDEGGAPAGTP
jgi:glutathione-specific gamma-glutamylcyclotransferase